MRVQLTKFVPTGEVYLLDPTAEIWPRGFWPDGGYKDDGEPRPLLHPDTAASHPALVAKLERAPFPFARQPFLAARQALSEAGGNP